MAIKHCHKNLIQNGRTYPSRQPDPRSEIYVCQLCPITDRRKPIPCHDPLHRNPPLSNQSAEWSVLWVTGPSEVCSVAGSAHRISSSFYHSLLLLRSAQTAAASTQLFPELFNQRQIVGVLPPRVLQSVHSAGRLSDTILYGLLPGDVSFPQRFVELFAGLAGVDLSSKRDGGIVVFSS